MALHKSIFKMMTWVFFGLEVKMYILYPLFHTRPFMEVEQNHVVIDHYKIQGFILHINPNKA